MKNVLLPTDLTVQSLRAVHDIVKDAKVESLSIHVVHLISLPTSITDLLFINESKPYHAVPQSFSEAFQLLRNKYQGRVDTMVFEFIYCTSSRYFNNFLEGINIDSVYMLTNYNYRQPLPQSQNLNYYLEKCKVPLFKVPVPTEDLSAYQNLSALFNGSEQLKVTESARTVKPTISYS